MFTHGPRADLDVNVKVSPESVGAELVRIKRGGDVTYHGPGQLVGYPIVTRPEWRDGLRDVVAYVRLLEDVLIGALDGFGIEAQREPKYTGVWVGDEKIAAIPHWAASDVFDEQERAVLAYADCLTAGDGRTPLAVFDKLKTFWSDEQIFEFTYITTLYLQQTHGLPAWQAGLLILPLALPLTVLSPATARLTARFGPHVPMAIGAHIQLCGARAPPSGSKSIRDLIALNHSASGLPSRLARSTFENQSR